MEKKSRLVAHQEYRRKRVRFAAVEREHEKIDPTAHKVPSPGVAVAHVTMDALDRPSIIDSGCTEYNLCQRLTAADPVSPSLRLLVGVPIGGLIICFLVRLRAILWILLFGLRSLCW